MANVTKEQYLRMAMKSFNKGIIAGIEATLEFLKEQHARGKDLASVIEAMDGLQGDLRAGVDMMGELALSSFLLESGQSKKEDEAARALKILKEISNN